MPPLLQASLTAHMETSPYFGPCTQKEEQQQHWEASESTAHIWQPAQAALCSEHAAPSVQTALPHTKNTHTASAYRVAVLLAYG